MRWWALLASLAALGGCRDNVADPDGAVVEPPVVAAVSAELLVPGSTLLIGGEGFLAEPAGVTLVRLRGAVDGTLRSITLAPAEVSARQLRLTVGTAFAALFGPAGGRFEGSLTVVVQPGDQPAAAETEVPVSLRFAPAVAPVLATVDATEVAPGALLPITGDGLIDGGEGHSELVLTGSFRLGDGTEVRVLGAALPLHARLGRSAGSFYLGAHAFPLAAGVFEGEAVLRTTNAAGEVQETPPRTVLLGYRGPRVDRLGVVGQPLPEGPPAAARGQVLRLLGRGLLPNDAEARTATLVHAEGTFTPTGADPDRGEPEYTSLTFIPEVWIDDGEVRLPLRTRLDAEGRPAGLGARAGRFEGKVQVELHAGARRWRSPPRDLAFVVQPPTQMVYLRYLPGFLDGVARFGLLGAEADLRARILAVCHRDYAGLRVRFVETPPAGWAEYVTVEVGGRDPNGRGLFGLDNTPTKDVGNLRLDELLGGRNAETAEAGSLAFGGIFVESFLTLSPRHPPGHLGGPSLIADARFDDVFGPFSPAVDPAAVPYAPGERLTGERVEQAEVAVAALANLIGTTITHEVGHALGLAAVEGQVHNPGDTEGELMDAGLHRPFAERAALFGTPPARFRGPNRAYLEALFGE